MIRSRSATPRYQASLGVAVLAFLAACGGDPVSPARAGGPAASPSLVTTPAGIVLATGETYWDFVDLNGSPTAPGSATNLSGSAFAAYTSRAVSNGAFGSITLTTDHPTGNPMDVNNHPFQAAFKWEADNDVPLDEKGVGVCPIVHIGLVDRCEGAGEIGEGGSVKLLMDMSGLAAGVQVKALVISSLQSNEKYTFALCATASSGCGALQTGTGALQAVRRVDISQGTSKWVQFSPNTVDYLVAGIVTTQALLNDQGCSPGYWKNHDSWPAPYSPNMLFSAVFDNAFPGMTMQQVLANGGGGLDALGRQTVSALLNATALGTSHYGLTGQNVIDQFNAVYPGSNYDTLKSQFEGRTDVNGRRCPLN